MVTFSDPRFAGAFRPVDRHRSARKFWRGPAFVAEVFDGADDALAAIEAVEADVVCDAFQTRDWLTVLFEELASANAATPRVIVVSDRDSGEVALVLPLLIERKRRFRVARFADLGVSHRGGPMLGPAAPTTPALARKVWRVARRALADVDMIRLERMPEFISERANPLAFCTGRAPSRHGGATLKIETTVADFLATIGAKHRTDIQRCRRLWTNEPLATFRVATDGEHIARVCSAMDEHLAAGRPSRRAAEHLAKPGHRSFYERMAIDGTEAGLCAVFSLECRGEIIATLMGIVHDGSFSVLQTSFARAEFGHFAPGRLILLEVMDYFSQRNVRNFQFASIDDATRRRFGMTDDALFDVVVARSVMTAPGAAWHWLRGRAGLGLRKTPVVPG